MSAYRDAKSKLISRAKYSVLNKDDAIFSFLKQKAGGKSFTFAIDNQADYTLKNITIKPKIPGKFNLYNILAAYATGKILKINEKIINRAISEFRGIPGRMEEIKTNKPFKVIIK